jgi:hypothetical protein
VCDSAVIAEKSASEDVLSELEDLFDSRVINMCKLWALRSGLHPLLRNPTMG